MTIAVTGANGQLGRLVIERLKAKVPAGHIAALVRDPAKSADLDVTLRPFDYNKPETLADELVGVEKLLLISGSEIGQREAQHKAVIAAAKKAGVGQIVYTSLLHTDTSPLSLATEHLATEEALKASGIPYVILRNGWYTENYAMGIAPALEHGALIGAAGEGRISSATRADFADAAVAVLTSDGHEGKTYELSGDESYSLAEFAAELSKQAGKEIPYVNLPEADLAAAYAGAGVPEGFAVALASFDVGASEGALFDSGSQLARLIGRATTPYSTVIAESLK